MHSSKMAVLLAGLCCMTFVYTYLYAMVYISTQTTVTAFQTRAEDDQDSMGSASLHRYFQPRMNEKEKDIMMDLLYQFHQTVTQNNITYFLYGGSLLGSYRHHDLIPWDEDIDVIVEHHKIKKLYAALQTLRPRLRLNTKVVPWKLYRATSHVGNEATQCHRYNWTWPFIDIFFFSQNRTHLWDVHSKYIRQYVFDRQSVFPLRPRPFGKLSLPSPHNTSKVLRTTYKPDICSSNEYNHRCEREIKNVLTVNCSLLESMYHFVQRKSTPLGCLETTNKTRFIDKKKRC